jgi:hypothetical protein
MPCALTVPKNLYCIINRFRLIAKFIFNGKQGLRCDLTDCILLFIRNLLRLVDVQVPESETVVCFIRTQRVLKEL